MLKRCAFVVVCLALAGSVEAQDAPSRAVQFPANKNAVTLQGAIAGRASQSYTFGGEAGQELRIRLRGNRSTYFNLYAPGKKHGDEALASSDRLGPFVPDVNVVRGVLPVSGTYMIDVYLVRAAARRGEKSNFKLEVALSPNKAAETGAPVQADFADGLQGGPDFWRIKGAGKTSVPLYREPARTSAVVTSFAEGAVLRNRGCRMVKAERWCQVEAANDAKIAGWIIGNKLAESGPPTDAVVAGTVFHATGEIPCATAKGQPKVPCRFGVVRQGLGKAEVSVFLPGGQTRILRFENGVPSGSDAPADARLSFKHQADLFLISINAERFEIPEAVVNGG